jgi:hypothetical protein
MVPSAETVCVQVKGSVDGVFSWKVDIRYLLIDEDTPYYHKLNINKIYFLYPKISPQKFEQVMSAYI